MRGIKMSPGKIRCPKKVGFLQDCIKFYAFYCRRLRAYGHQPSSSLPPSHKRLARSASDSENYSRNLQPLFFPPSADSLFPGWNEGFQARIPKWKMKVNLEILCTLPSVLPRRNIHLRYKLSIFVPESMGNWQ